MRFKNNVMGREGGEEEKKTKKRTERGPEKKEDSDQLGE